MMFRMNSIDWSPKMPNDSSGQVIMIEPDQSRSNQINTDQYRSNQIKPDQTRSIQIKPDQYRSIQINPDQTRAIQINPNQTRSIQINPDQTKSRQINSDRTWNKYLFYLISIFIYFHFLGNYILRLFLAWLISCNLNLFFKTLLFRFNDLIKYKNKS